MKKSDLRRRGGLAIAAATAKRIAESEIERLYELGIIDDDITIIENNDNNININHNNNYNNENKNNNDDNNDNNNSNNNDENDDNDNNDHDNSNTRSENDILQKSFIRSAVMNSLSEPLILTHDPAPLKLLTREELRLIAFKREKEKEKEKEKLEVNRKEIERRKAKEKKREKESLRSIDSSEMSGTYRCRLNCDIAVRINIAMSVRSVLSFLSYLTSQHIFSWGLPIHILFSSLPFPPLSAPLFFLLISLIFPSPFASFRFVSSLL